MTKTFRVKLRNTKPLTGTGYVWEFFLMQRGWNNLLLKEQYGLISADQIGWDIANIRFPACDIELLLFSDEYEVLQVAGRKVA